MADVRRSRFVPLSRKTLLEPQPPEICGESSCLFDSDCPSDCHCGTVYNGQIRCKFGPAPRRRGDPLEVCGDIIDCPSNDECPEGCRCGLLKDGHIRCFYPPELDLFDSYIDWNAGEGDSNGDED